MNTPARVTAAAMTRAGMTRVTVAAITIDLLCWIRLLLLDGPLANPEPRTLPD